MFAGHFALAAAMRAKEPVVPLWALMVGTQLLDIAFIPLLIAGAESLQPIGSGGYGEQIIHADYTHSLVVALVIAGIAGLIAKRCWGKRAGWIIAGIVFSHWVLDFIVHRMDMPLLPGNLGDLPFLGLGLWGEPLLSIIVELLMVIFGSLLYFRFVLSRTTGDPIRYKRAMVAGITMTVLLFLSLLSSIVGI